MAKELGFQPRSLIKNIPSPSQQWKAPVKEWVRSLYEKKIGGKKPSVPHAPNRPPVVELRNPADPWPDHPDIPDLPPLDLDEEDDFASEEEFWGRPRWEPPSDEKIAEQNGFLIRRQRLFRWAAQSIAVAMSELAEVQRVAAFGAASQPLEMEVPRFREFRRHGIEVYHECADLDLAVWTTDLDRLKELKRALGKGLRVVQHTPYGGVAQHQVDVHLFDSAVGDYQGRLCIFGECPKPGKRECFVPDCGAHKFLQQFEGYRFKPARFAGEPKVILFDRAGGFLVRMPADRREGTTSQVANAPGRRRPVPRRWGRPGNPLLEAAMLGYS